MQWEVCSLLPRFTVSRLHRSETTSETGIMTTNNAPGNMSNPHQHVGVDRDSTATEAILGGAAGAVEGTWPNPGGDSYQNGETVEEEEEEQYQLQPGLPPGAETPPWDISEEDLRNLIASMGEAESVAANMGMPVHLHEAVVYHLMQALTTFHRVQRPGT